MKILFVLLSSLFLIGMVSAALELKTNQYVSLQVKDQSILRLVFQNENGKNVVYKNLPINTSSFYFSGVTGAYEFPPTDNAHQSYYLKDVVANINVFAAMSNKTSAVRMYLVVDPEYNHSISETSDEEYDLTFRGELFVESLTEGKINKKSYNQTFLVWFNKNNMQVAKIIHSAINVDYQTARSTGIFKVYDANVCPVLEARQITKLNRTSLLRER